MFALRHALVCYETGAIYSFIPKNACSTLRYSIAIANGCIRGPDDFGWIHHNNTTFSASLADVARAKYSFVVLRCPLQRLSSVFLDKFVSNWAPVVERVKTAFPRTKIVDLTFRGFIEMLSKDDFIRADSHWRPQSDFLVYENYTNWFDLANFAAAVPVIQKRAGVTVHDARGLAQHGTDRFTLRSDACFADMPIRELKVMFAQGECPSHAAMFDPELIEVTQHIYADDTKMFTEKAGASVILSKAKPTGPDRHGRNIYGDGLYKV